MFLQRYKRKTLVILIVLLFTACLESKPVKTETRVYELTFVDGKTEIYTFKNVNVDAVEGIAHTWGGYQFYLWSSKNEYIEAVIRYKRIK